MKIIYDELPCSIQIDGYDYPVNTDFRIWVKFEEIFKDKEIATAEMLTDAIMLCYPAGILPPTALDAVRGLFEFYRCGDYDSESDKKDDENKPHKKEKNIYDYYHDADYLYAAFMEQYGIDLADEQLHWWKFRALFLGLSSNTKLKEIMGIRAMNTSEISDKKLKEHYKKLQRVYALPDMRSEEEKENDIASMLW